MAPCGRCEAQLGLVYVFAGLAKLNDDWLFHALPLGLWLPAHTGLPLVGPFLDVAVVAFAASWAGALFDLTIVGWLSWSRTRPFAYAAVVVFHGITAVLFPIGMFPWIMIASTLIFFGYDWPDRILARAGRWSARPARPLPRPPGRMPALCSPARLSSPWPYRSRCPCAISPTPGTCAGRRRATT